MFVFLLSFSIVVLVFYYGYRERRLTTALPPGPPRLPIVGNILDLPGSTEPEYIHWLKLKDKYGPISSVTAFGQTIVILHDKQAALDILEKTASKSSGRPKSTLSTMIGYDNIMGFKQYNASWRRHRKMLHQELGTRRVSSQFNSVQDAQSLLLLSKLLKTPHNLTQHIKAQTGALVLKFGYGYTVNQHKPDPLVLVIERMMSNLSDAHVPGSWMVDLIPPLRFLPRWLPGMGFKTTAKAWFETLRLSREVPYAFVESQMIKGTHKPSFVSRQIQHSTKDSTEKLDPDVKDDIRWTACQLYGAVSDTTAGTLTAFFLAMTMFPEVQSKAQKEIDAAIGPDRLPEIGDQDQLPYISAVVKELLRWFPIVPMGVAHAADEDIHYRGYTLPKGSILLPATWWFANDPDVYCNPSAFEPERFIAPRHEPDPAEVVFGHGRRICPGRHFAEMSIFWTISRILAVLDIRKAVDESGMPLDTTRRFLPGLISHPAEFPFDIVARSPFHAKLVEDLEKKLPMEVGDDGLLNFQC